MFSDTHFHFKMMTSEWGVNGSETLQTMALKNCKFGLDIGTRSQDLEERKKAIENAISKINDVELQQKAKNFIYYSAGIWPDVESIHDRVNQIHLLREEINKFDDKKKIVAIGEGGIDHHWNPSGVDGRCESDFDTATYNGERELFEMQLELAKEMNLPMIIHSRDGFEDTLDCIKNISYHKGIVHCFSYGIEQARTFLDLGWYIAFGGGVTYTKKSKMDSMNELLRFIPEDRFLCETDSPYLAPVPFRGQSNSPVLVEHVYNFIAQARGITSEDLSNTVDNNIQKLFGLSLNLTK